MKFLPLRTNYLALRNKTPPSEAETDTRPSEDPLSGTEAPPTSSEAPPPSQSDGDDNQQVDAASKFDPRPE